MQDVLVVPVTGKTAIRKHTSPNQKQANKNPTVVTNGYLGKHKNGTSPDDIPQQVFPQPSTILAQAFPGLNTVSGYLISLFHVHVSSPLVPM